VRKEGPSYALSIAIGLLFMLEQVMPKSMEGRPCGQRVLSKTAPCRSRCGRRAVINHHLKLLGNRLNLLLSNS